MAITWTDDNTSINTCEEKSDWTGSGFSNPDNNNSGSATPVYREGTGCMQAAAGKGTTGYWYDTINYSLTGKALVAWIWFSGPLELSYFDYFTVRGYQGANYVDYDFLPEISVKNIGGWFPAVCWMEPSGEVHITNSGTPAVANMDELRFTADQTSTTNDVKLLGWDYIHAIGYVGAAADTVTLEDFVVRDAAQNFGVISQVGTTFQAQCKVQYGGSGVTVIDESNKTLTFRGASEDHPVGFVFASGGTSLDISYTDMVFNWTFPQEVYDLTGTPDSLKVNGSSFNSAGGLELPAHSVDRYHINCKINNCGEVDLGDGIFENNVVANALSGVRYVGTGTRRAKNNSFLGCTDAMHFDTAQDITLDGDTFSGNTTDIHFSGTGTLNVSVSNGANPSTSRVSGGGTVNIILGQNTFDFTVNPSITGYEWRLYVDSGVSGELGTVLLAGEETATQDNQSYSYTYTVDTDVVLQIIATGYEEFNGYYTLSNVNQSNTVNLKVEGNT